MSLVWTVIYAPKAVRDIDALPKDIAKRVILKMREIALDPYGGILEKMRNLPFYKFRVGGYRGIVQIQNKKLILYVVKVKSRGRAYKK